MGLFWKENALSYNHRNMVWKWSLGHPAYLCSQKGEICIYTAYPLLFEISVWFSLDKTF